MILTRIEQLSKQYNELKDKADFRASCVMLELLRKMDSPAYADKIRDVLGSRAWRRLEEYKAIRAPMDAAFTEWIDLHLKEPNPFE